MGLIKNNLRHLQTTGNEFFNGLPINASLANQAYSSVLERSYRELCLILAHYHRVVLVRLDLHYGSGNPFSIDMTKFCRSFVRKLESKYKTKVAYQWVRESGRGHDQGVHWHLWVAVKNVERHQPHTQAENMQKAILDSWVVAASGQNDRNHGSGWFYLQRKQLALEARKQEQHLIALGGEKVLINMQPLKEREKNQGLTVGGVIDECFYAISYLAKVYTKVRTPAGAGKRTFGNSNLNTEHKRVGRAIEIRENLRIVKDCLALRVDAPLAISG